MNHLNMEMILSILIMMLIFYIIYLKAKKKNTEEAYPMEEANQFQENSNSEWETKDLCIKVLKRLNCEIEQDSELEERFYFLFQGEAFFIDAKAGSPMIQIWDSWWMEVPLENLDEMARVRKAINYVNLRSTNTLVFTINEEENKFIVHTKKTCPFIRDIPDLDDYMKAMLESFFYTQRALQMVIEQETREEGRVKT